MQQRERERERESNTKILDNQSNLAMHMAFLMAFPSPHKYYNNYYKVSTGNYQ